ncbi:MAG: c-type cytochrome [Alphaproteobacteria bacterium]
MVLKAERVIVPVLLAGAALLAPAAGLAATAAENFQWYCAQCHGAKGGGDGVNSTVKELPVGPMNLSKAKEIKKFSNEDIINTVTHGGPVNRLESLMPPWGNRLSQDEIKALMRFVRTLCQEADCPK